MTMEERISSVIAAYDGQGWHRTATEIDNQSAQWLMRQLADAGAIAAVETYPFQRLVPSSAFLEVAGQRIEGISLFDSLPTGAEGVSGTLGEGKGSIALVSAPAGGHSSELLDARMSSATGIVLLSVGREGLAPRNAEDFGKAWGPPVLQIAGNMTATVTNAAARGEAVRLVSDFSFEESTYANVTGVVRGTDPAAAPVCVMTPRSGWWNCASERGGGIACLLEVARAAATAQPRRNVYFVATTAHELGYLGLAEFLLRRPGLDRGALRWIHFGASVGAAIEPRPSMFFSRPALANDVVEALKRAGSTLPTIAPDGTEPGGESRNIHRVGGEYVSFAGGSALFHLEADRWPQAVNVKQVAAVASAMAEYVVDVANS